MTTPTPARREVMAHVGALVGGAALATLLGRDRSARPDPPAAEAPPGPPAGTHHPARAKRVIMLFQSGGPSHVDLFDPKPELTARHGRPTPPAALTGDNVPPIQTRGQTSFPLVGAATEFVKGPRAGLDFSAWLPHTAAIDGELAVVRSLVGVNTNHDPAATFWLTGDERPGRPAAGAWLSYGLGAETEDLPAYVVLISGSGGQALQTGYWGNGFLPGRHQGVLFRSSGDPVLYLANPPGLDPAARRRLLDAGRELNLHHEATAGDPEIGTRVAAYEQAFRMQAAVPGLADLSTEPRAVLDAYGADPATPSYATNCLLARRLVERGVRFVQLCHRDWDHHGALPFHLARQCAATDRASAALVSDLRARGLLDDTLVIWGGEFGRTPYSQGPLSAGDNGFGRDHHCRCFSIWLAGGGVKGGQAYGATDPLGFEVTENPVTVHDLHATMLHLLGVDHTRLVFQHQGREFRLTDTAGRVVSPLLA
ncbi:DUF1501 domain-containing protein [bacterium]|nr:DUF1501 domain-containing protein [bacterium]